MNISEFSILCGGVLSALMVSFHLRFYKLFGWAEDFEKIHPKNRKILYTIHIALILFFIIFSFLSFIYYKELASASGPAFGITLLYALLWLWRTIWQIVYFKYPAGTKKPTLHYIVILFCSLLFIAYSLPLLLLI